MVLDLPSSHLIFFGADEPDRAGRQTLSPTRVSDCQTLQNVVVVPSEEFELTKMSWGDHDILTATSRYYFTATSF